MFDAARAAVADAMNDGAERMDLILEALTELLDEAEHEITRLRAEVDELRRPREPERDHSGG
jgi:hypothetical protein